MLVGPMPNALFWSPCLVTKEKIKEKTNDVKIHVNYESSLGEVDR